MSTVSPLNYMVGAVLVSATSAEPAWPATHLQRADEPLMTWRSTSTAQQQIVFNLGAALQVGLIGLVNVNVAHAQLELASDSGISSNVVTRTSAPRACPTGRLQWGELWPSAPVRQYLRLTIPAQTPTDGAAYFHCGGLWAGAATPWPRGLALDATMDVREPSIDVRGVGDGGVSSLSVGEPYLVLTGRRIATVGREEGVNDEWEAWTTLDTAMRRAGVVGVLLSYGNPAHFWPMRRKSRPRWAHTRPIVQDTLTLEESIHP